MSRKDIRNIRMRKIANLVTALMFTALTLYHIFLLLFKNQARTGRLLVIASFAVIAVASYFALVPRSGLATARTALLIAGLLFNFIIRLFNANAMFRMLDFSNVPTVLNFAVYVFSQTAEIILLLYYMIFRHNKKLSKKRALGCSLMSLVILLYLSCLIMECVLLIKYGWNIDLSLKYTLVSRFVYFLGFSGIAVNCMIPVPQFSSENTGSTEQQAPTEPEVLFSVPDDQRTKVDLMEKPETGKSDADFII